MNIIVKTADGDAKHRSPGVPLSDWSHYDNFSRPESDDFA
jgi:hypothetical protein